MEDGDKKKYHSRRVIQDFVFLSRKRDCIRCISLQVYSKTFELSVFWPSGTENWINNLRFSY